MATKTMFRDVLDYIFIDNGNAPESFLLSNDVVSASFPSSGHVAAPNATSFFMADSSSNEIFSNTSSTSAAPTSSSEASSSATENLYSSVAYGLSTLYMNESFLLDMNTTTATTATATMTMTTTTLFGVLANGSDLNINGTDDETTSEDIAELVKMAATTIVLGLMILITIIGNVFVIAAIILERNLQNVANYLVASLAVADLLVACLVMPLGAVYEISQGWILGPELCDIWTSCDVLCCTASILHLVAIATDRYWAVTNIDYMHSRTSRRIFLMIFMVWFAAVIVSLAPQFGWKDPDYLQRIEQQKCMVSQDVAYQVFATCCTFYVPLLVILALYWKIYQTARKRIHRRRPRPIDVAANNNQPDLSQKKRKRLRLRIGKFSGEKGKSGPTLGLVEGNSTNTVNTVEDTEFSSSNMDSKSRGGVEVTTNFSCTEEPTTSTSQISTVSHLVALASQQHQQLQHQHPLTSTTTATTVSNKFEHNQNVHNSHQLQQHLHDHHQLHHPHQHHPQQSTKKIAAAAVVNGDCTTPTATTTTTTSDKSLAPPTTLAIATATAAISSLTTTTTTTTITTAINNAADSGDVLEDHQLQQQIQQQVTAIATEAAAATEAPATVATVADTDAATSDAATLNDNSVTNHDAVAVAVASVVGAAGSAAATSAGGGGATTASAATTITSISAISPQTPLNPSGGISLAPAGTTTIAVAINAPHQQQHQQHHPQPHHPPHQLQSSANASNQVTPLTHPKQSSHLSSIPNPHSKVTKRKETLEAKRERKAAKTLAIITGAFVVCWLPFFVMALLLPLCDDCEINDAIASFFLWMGYFNSTLNPVIYTIFSPEFRQAFKRILFGGHRPVHYRSGKI